MTYQIIIQQQHKGQLKSLLLRIKEWFQISFIVIEKNGKIQLLAFNKQEYIRNYTVF